MEDMNGGCEVWGFFVLWLLLGGGTELVLTELLPLDQLAVDGQLAAEGLEGGVAHGCVVIVEGLLELSLNAADGLESVGSSSGSVLLLLLSFC